VKKIYILKQPTEAPIAGSIRKPLMKNGTTQTGILSCEKEDCVKDFKEKCCKKARIKTESNQKTMQEWQLEGSLTKF